jgi:hypothetical protein
MTEVEFVVEQAGCDACAARIENALSTIGDVRSIEVDEPADVASVRLVESAPISAESVRLALAAASEGSGHVYRLRPGSWKKSSA